MPFANAEESNLVWRESAEMLFSWATLDTFLFIRQ